MSTDPEGHKCPQCDFVSAREVALKIHIHKKHKTKTECFYRGGSVGKALPKQREGKKERKSLPGR
jgi:uncharacterized C2H2 Zn-finger protein